MAEEVPGLTHLGGDQYRLRVSQTDPLTGRRKDIRRMVRATSLSEAKRRLEVLRAQMVLRDPAVESKPIPRVSEFADTWIEVMAPMWKFSTKTNYEAKVRIFRRELGHLRLDKLTREVIQKWRTEQAKKVSATTVNNRLRALRAMLREAERMGIVQMPDMRRIYLPEQKKSKVLRPDELERFVAEVRKSERHLYPLTLMLARTGMRFGEAIALTWEQIDYEAGAILIDRNVYQGTPQKTTKGGVGRSRRVPMLDDVRHMLKGQDRYARLVIPNPTTGNYMFQGITTNPYLRAIEKSGIGKRVSPHWFRHTMNNAIRRQAGEVVAASLLGHRMASMTAWYSEVSLSEMRHAIEQAFSLAPAVEAAE